MEYTTSPATITLFGTSWCGTSRASRRVLDAEGIEYVYVDVDKDKEAASFVKQLNKGFRSVPTIVFTDGSVLVEPSPARLREKLATLSGK